MFFFLGDWFENRSALNIATLNFAYQGAKRLNNLGLPVYFCIGNHDLYHRHTRDIHSIIPYQEFSNFILINDPTVVSSIGNGVLLCPYLFHHEYDDLKKYFNIPIWAGHFEFQGFTVTGHGIKMQTGPNPKQFGGPKGPKHIFSGHFHKRQQQDNIQYIGNVFPMDFGDVGDVNRGMMVYDYTVDNIKFINWPDCPQYVKAKYTDILDGTVNIPLESRVRCIMDDPSASYEEVMFVRATWIEKFNLREFIMEETSDFADALSDTTTTVDVNGVEITTTVDSIGTEIHTFDELVVKMLQDIKSEHIDNTLLVEQYRKIPS